MNAVLLQRWAPIVKVVKSPGGYADDAFIERCEIEQVRATDRAEGPDQRLSRIGEQILIPRQCFFPFSYREAFLPIYACGVQRTPRSSPTIQTIADGAPQLSSLSVDTKLDAAAEAASRLCVPRSSGAATHLEVGAMMCVRYWTW